MNKKSGFMEQLFFIENELSIRNVKNIIILWAGHVRKCVQTFDLNRIETYSIVSPSTKQKEVFYKELQVGRCNVNNSSWLEVFSRDVLNKTPTPSKPLGKEYVFRFRSVERLFLKDLEEFKSCFPTIFKSLLVEFEE